MNVFYNSQHHLHRPPHEIFHGNREPHQEVPERVDRILLTLRNAGHEIIDAHPNRSQTQELLRVLSQLHTPKYIHYLQTAQFGEAYMYPSVFSYRAEDAAPTHSLAAQGFYSFDLYTPLNKTTYAAALGSAHLAQRAAEAVLESQQAQYALCRPPGHHAEPARMGGYCYFNNGGVAAQIFRNAHPQNRVAILDVDFHHGNGAEKIFGGREKILTVSIHADPSEKFPFFSGSENNTYVSNRNFPLPLGTTDAQYAQALGSALQAVRQHGTTHLVVCFGADTHESDPIGGFRLTTNFFTEMARQIRALHIPTVIIQEGGYNTAALGKNVEAFLMGVGG
jgi:acetoin utilization deacetylase AcuC-like enzyme